MSRKLQRRAATSKAEEIAGKMAALSAGNYGAPVPYKLGGFKRLGRNRIRFNLGYMPVGDGFTQNTTLTIRRQPDGLLGFILGDDIPTNESILHNLAGSNQSILNAWDRRQRKAIR
jgi:hypothetical protein